MPYNPKGRVFVGFMGNLREGIYGDDLLGVFKKYGPIAEVVVKIAQRCAFVVFENRKDAFRACGYMNGTRLRGVKIAVRMANERVENRNAAEPQRRRFPIPKEAWPPTSFSAAGAGAKSQPPPDRRRLTMMETRMRSSSPSDRGRSRKLFDPAQIYGRDFQSSMGGQSRPSPAVETRVPDVTKGSSAESKDYRLVVNNLSSTIKWREINDFLQKEAGWSLTEDERRNAFDKSYYVDFATRRGMEDAMKKLDGKEIAGKTVRFYSDVRTRKKGEKKKADRISRPRRNRYASRSSSAPDSGDGKDSLDGVVPGRVV